jgi:hypothetical protein
VAQARSPARRAAPRFAWPFGLSLTERQALSAQHVVLNFSQAPGRPTLDLFLQLVSIATGVAPVVLVFYCWPGTASGRRLSA